MSDERPLLVEHVRRGGAQVLLAVPVQVAVGRLRRKGRLQVVGPWPVEGKLVPRYVQLVLRVRLSRLVIDESSRVELRGSSCSGRLVAVVD